MSLPKAGKVSIQTPQATAGAPKIATASGKVNPGKATNPIKGPLKVNPAPRSSSGLPEQGGNKIKTKIQTGTKASHSKG